MLVVPENQYNEEVINILPIDSSGAFINECGDDNFYIEWVISWFPPTRFKCCVWLVRESLETHLFSVLVLFSCEHYCSYSNSVFKLMFSLFESFTTRNFSHLISFCDHFRTIKYINFLSAPTQEVSVGIRHSHWQLITTTEQSVAIVIQMVQMTLNVNCSVDSVTVSQTLLVGLVHNVGLVTLVSQTVKVSSGLQYTK